MNIGMTIDPVATDDPDRIALILDKRMIEYGQLAAAVERCAAGLAANGVVAGNRVPVVDGGSLLSIASVLGAARIGAAAALMNPALATPELRGLLQNAGCAEVGVAGEASADRLREAGVSRALTAADLLSDSLIPPAKTLEDVDDGRKLPWSCSPAAPPGARRLWESPAGN